MQTTFYNDPEIHKAFLEICEKEGISMSEALRKLILLFNDNPKIIKK